MSIDAHCHVAGKAERSFICVRPDAPVPEGPALVRFYGYHPWDAAQVDEAALSLLRRRLEDDPGAGVGEIGLDRLRERDVSDSMRRAFAAQLEIAAEFGRPVVLHGAKCWGQVVAACRPFTGRIPAFLFHGFSRSGGLLPDIGKLNGFVSVGPAVLNDHAVNYRVLVKAIPDSMLLAESDATDENFAALPSIAEIVAKIAEIRGTSAALLDALTERNAARFDAPRTKFSPASQLAKR